MREIFASNFETKNSHDFFEIQPVVAENPYALHREVVFVKRK